jgi:ABC-type antimicrobial peptide transport system permease subunit
MADALIFNAMTVSIGERESEVATLQANGVGRSWIRRTITLENLAIVFAGVVPGLILGRLLGAAFLNQFSTPQFTFRAEIAPVSLFASVFIIAVAAVAAQFPGLRSLDKLDLPAKVRERNV